MSEPENSEERVRQLSPEGKFGAGSAAFDPCVRDTRIEADWVIGELDEGVAEAHATGRAGKTRAL